MKRHITVTVIMDTDDKLGLIRDDIGQELNCCWHHPEDITVMEEEAECKNCAKAERLASGAYECTAEEYDIEELNCFVPREYDIKEVSD
jgi:hypothetical protein